MVWLALAVALLAVVVSATMTTLKGLEAFRAFKSLGRTAGEELARIEASAAQIERHLALASTSGTRLDAELEQLRRSRARLNVLRSALDDVTAAVGRVTAVYPRK